MIKKAFSLIEAMIILLMISIAIMVLIPLISQKTSFPRWMKLKDQNVITYGNSSADRVGIGSVVTGKNDANEDIVSSANPYTDTDAAKLVTLSLAFNYIADANTNNIVWSDNFANGVYDSISPAGTNTSIVMGLNACSAIVDNTIILKSQSSPNACAANTIAIGNDTSIIANNNGLFFNDGARNLISVNSDGSVQILFANPDGTGTNALSVSSANIQIGGLPEGMYDPGADATLKVGGEAGDGTITFDVGGDPGWRPDSEISDCSGEKHSGKCDCSDFIKSETTGSTYCYDSYKETDGVGASQVNKLWRYSDRRLKNIVAEYKKGFDAVSKIDTYIYSFKSDVKNRLHVGLIAQKIIGLFDEALSKDEKGFYSYDKSPILYSMVNSVKEIYKKQLQIEKENKKLNKEADKLIRMYE